MFERFLICVLFASNCVLNVFICLIFLRSLRFLFVTLFFALSLALLLLWESENTHLYFSACLFSASPNLSIILLNWAILAWMFVAISFTFVIVTSVFTTGVERAGLLVQFSFRVDVFSTFGRFDFLSSTRA